MVVTLRIGELEGEGERKRSRASPLALSHADWGVASSTLLFRARQPRNKKPTPRPPARSSIHGRISLFAITPLAFSVLKSFKVGLDYSWQMGRLGCRLRHGTSDRASQIRRGWPRTVLSPRCLFQF